MCHWHSLYRCLTLTVYLTIRPGGAGIIIMRLSLCDMYFIRVSNLFLARNQTDHIINKHNTVLLVIYYCVALFLIL